MTKCTKANEEFQEKLKFIRLGGLLANWDRYLEIARKEDFSHVRLLKYVVEEEYNLKKENIRESRLRRARIPEELVMETFPFHQQPQLDKKKILNIYDSFNYISKNQNITFIGPTGAGKTGLATAFLIQAINRGYSGRFIEFPELIELLYKSIGDHSEKKVLKKFTAYDCLLVDELDYVEVEPAQVGLFFTLMKQRYGRKNTMITSNLGFEEWASFLKNRQLTAALIDRLTSNSYIVSFKKCLSIRPKTIQA